MCGIAGFFHLDRSRSWSSRKITDHLFPMLSRLKHRGPDNQGFWTDPSVGLAIGHRRLSILDLSQEGHQPMVSRNGRWVLSLNGEIYNFADLRSQLEQLGHTFRSHSDTEVFLTLIQELGAVEATKKTVGMFAFALYDCESRTLYLGRDRLGEKPLYYGWSGNCFLFASEIKALQANPFFTNPISRDVVNLFVHYTYIPSPYSIFEGIFKLVPGTILAIPVTFPPGREQPSAYWSAADAVISKDRGKFQTLEAAAQELDFLLRDSIKKQMVADVPLGAFLSGGIDSSTVVAIMQSQTPKPVKTFTIGFRELGFDEAPHAKAIAKHLGTDHTECYVSPRDALEVIPQLPDMFDEPFADSSQIPTFLVARLARSQVTVSLSGDGGDELFGGYLRYPMAASIWRKLALIPSVLKAPLGSLLEKGSISQWDSLLESLPSCIGKRALTGEKIRKAASLLSAQRLPELYQHFVSLWNYDSEAVVLGAREIRPIFLSPEKWPLVQKDSDLLPFFDLLTYLPDDILVKVDRTCMAVSLESRVPFLDHRIVEWAQKLPSHFKMKNGETKRVLRKVLYNYVPRDLVERPKMGFGLPLGEWLRGPLRPWAEDLLEENKLRKQGFFNPELIRTRWEQHVSQFRNWQYELWGILMFQAWLEKQGQNLLPERAQGVAPRITTPCSMAGTFLQGAT